MSDEPDDDCDDPNTFIPAAQHYLKDTQGMIDRVLNDPVLGKCFVMPDPPLPPLPWEVEELEGEQ